MYFFSLQNEWTALIKASNGGHVKCVKLLLNNHAEVKNSGLVSMCNVTVWHVNSVLIGDAHTLYYYVLLLYLSIGRMLRQSVPYES